MGSLGIDIKLLVAQLINFGLFFLIFKKFIAKPFSSFLNIEVEKEKEKEKILEDLKKKEERMLAEEKKASERIKKQYDEAVRVAREEAAKIRESLIVDAKKEAEEIAARGRRQVTEEKDKMEKQMKQQIVDLSVSIVSKALDNFLTKEMQKDITRTILKNYSKKLD